MKRLIELNKDWFDKSNELFVEFVKKGSDAYSDDISFLNLKRDTYFALTNLMFQLADGRVSIISSDTKKEMDDADTRNIDKFKEEICDIFAKFEKGRSYENKGFIESVVDLVGRRTHSETFKVFSSGDLKGLQEVFENFWIDFFKLKNTGDTSSDTKRLNELLDSFEQKISKELSN